MRPLSGARRPLSVVAAVPLLALALTLVVAARAAAAPGDAAQRAYEMVSPPDKRGSDVTAIGTVQAAADGNSLSYISGGGFAGAPTSQLVGPYAATRGAGGAWANRSLSLPQTAASQLLSATIVGMSDDMTRSVQVSYSALAPGAVADQLNIYLVTHATNERELVATTNDSSAKANWTAGATYVPIAGTPSFDTIAFTMNGALTPDASPTGTNVYAFSNGALRLASVAPDGTAVPGATIGNGTPRPVRQNAVSDDGSTIFFQSADTFTTYMRKGGTTTEFGPLATFEGATSDGSAAYFSTFLEPGPGEGAGLHRYDTATGTRTSMTPGAADFLSGTEPRVVGVGADEDYLWFTSTSSLTPDAQQGPTNLYVTREGTTQLVAELDSNNAGVLLGVAVSESGRHLAFQSYDKLTAASTSSPDCLPTFGSSWPAGACQVLYAADGATGGVTCASCPADGARALGHSSINVNGNERPSYGFYAARAVLDDGTVFFDTPNALERRDVNGITDVYQWRAGQAELITTGTRPEPATFADASADGRDLFFYTRAPLAGRDSGDDVDLYDARVGGVADTTTPPESPRACVGDTCQGPQTPAPQRQQPGTASFSGPGNAVPAPPKKAATKKAGTKKKSSKKKAKAKRCRKGTKRVKSKGKTRCVKVKKKTTKKRATTSARRAK